MKILQVIALSLVATWAHAQGHPGEDRREEALFGTPQKTPDGGVYVPEPQDAGQADAGTKSPRETADAGTPTTGDLPDTETPPSDRPSESDLFGGEPEATDRPSESDLFGGPTEPGEPPAESAAEAPGDTAPTRDERALEDGWVDRFATGDYVEDPLDIGGLYYQRFLTTNRAGDGFGATTLSAPTLIDAYFDARPNDRLRAMVVARLLFDPLLGEEALAAQLLGQERDNPSLALDQMWLRFDIARRVFVTVGRQHVKWGAGRFWTPTDFLHPVRRDSLALFDERVGTNLVKLHVPVEETGGNFYAIGVLDNGLGGVGSLEDVGGAARAEWVFGTTEVGVDALVQRGSRPRYGFDISGALGPVDAYAEVALRTGPTDRWTLEETPAGTLPRLTREGDYSVAATGGVNWTFAWSESDTLTVGGEYFFNPTGYDDPDLYPLLLFTGAFQPFYVGQHYAALFALLPSPGSWDKTSFVLSNLANLSDRSYVTRLDFTVRVLTHLTVEASASAFYGDPRGEFRLRLEVPPTVVNGQAIPAFTLPEQRFAFGLGLRLDI